MITQEQPIFVFWFLKLCKLFSCKYACLRACLRNSRVRIELNLHNFLSSSFFLRVLTWSHASFKNIMTDEKKIYLDYNATTPLEPSVLSAIHDALRDAWGNPSSSYAAGKKASHVIKEARTSIASMIGASSGDIIFLSGGTEGNNMVIHSALEYFHGFNDQQDCKPHVITSNLEHDSIQLPLLKLKEQGKIDVTFVPASPDSGAVTAEGIMQEVRPSTCLVTVMMANNETGVIQVIDVKIVTVEPPLSGPLGYWHVATLWRLATQ